MHTSKVAPKSKQGATWAEQWAMAVWTQHMGEFLLVFLHCTGPAGNCREPLGFLLRHFLCEQSVRSFISYSKAGKKTFLIHKRQVSTWKLMTKLNLCSPCILRWHQITQWAFLASRYLSARWITSFSESSEMFGGPFIKEYSSHLSTSAMLTNHNVLLFSPASSSLPFHKFSYQCHSSPHLVLHIPAEMR